MSRTTLLALAALLTVADWQVVNGAPCEDPNGCEATFNCNKTLDGNQVPQAVCFISKCERAIQDHVQFEFNAAFTYLAMGAHFAQETINRPGIAKFLLGAASEERSHAILMLDYLNKRGIPLKTKNGQYEYVTDPVIQDRLNKLEMIDYKDALTQALNMELDVTQRIYHVIKACDEDYHGADVFTNPILDEQHHGVRGLQGAIKTFDNLAEGAMNSQYKSYAEYTFDMKLLKGEIAM